MGTCRTHEDMGRRFCVDSSLCVAVEYRAPRKDAKPRASKWTGGGGCVVANDPIGGMQATSGGVKAEAQAQPIARSDTSILKLYCWASETGAKLRRGPARESVSAQASGAL